MKNTHLTITISMILFTIHPVFAAEDKTGEFPETPCSPTVQPTFFDGEGMASSDSSSLPSSPAEKSMEISLEKKTVSSERKISKTLPLDYRRKNSGSTKVRKMGPSSILMSLNQTMAFLENQGKDRREEKGFPSSLQGKQQGFLERLAVTPKRTKKNPHGMRPRCVSESTTS